MHRSFPVGRRRRWALAAGACAVIVVAASVGVAAASSGARAGSQDVAPTWSVPNATLANTRTISSSINSSNVAKLSVAWTIPLRHPGLYGFYANTPVFDSDGTIYFQDLTYDVFAVNGTTGRILWTHLSHRKQESITGQSTIQGQGPYGEGPNGVMVSNGLVYGETPSYAFALDAKTGKQLWRTPNLAENKGQGFNIAPELDGGSVYLSTSGQLHGGIAYALNAKTGKVLWQFQETKDPAERTLGGTDGTGGAWNTPAIGPDGTVYYGIANPYRSISQAINHPTSLLYNDSIIALTPRGQIRWHYQGVPNDFHDWDMSTSPIYTDVNGQPAVVDAGKMGYVYAVNADTGKLIWKTPVGKHNGHDNDGLLALQHKFRPRLPYVFFPGDLGGVETNMAIADGVVYVPVVNLGAMFTNEKSNLATAQSFAKGTGEMEALDLATGKVLWDTKLPQMAFGDATVTNDLVFTTTFDGDVFALSRSTGAIAWQAKLSASTNSALSINGNMLVTAASLPTGKGQKPEIVAYRLPSGTP